MIKGRWIVANMRLIFDRGRMGMKIQIRVGFWRSNKFQVQVGLGMGPHKTLPVNICIADKLIHRHKMFEYLSTTTSNFPWPQNFSAFLAYVELQTNEYCL